MTERAKLNGRTRDKAEVGDTVIGGSETQGPPSLSLTDARRVPEDSAKARYCDVSPSSVKCFPKQQRLSVSASFESDHAGGGENIRLGSRVQFAAAKPEENASLRTGKIRGVMADRGSQRPPTPKSVCVTSRSIVTRESGGNSRGWRSVRAKGDVIERRPPRSLTGEN